MEQLTLRRTIIIGDIHGCRDELEDLLDATAYAKGDRVVSVGDMIVRGPDPSGTVALLRSIGALAVRGNHEDRVLRVYEAAALHVPRRGPGEFRGAGDIGGAGDISGMTKSAAYALGEEERAWLRGLPLWLDLPENGVRVVHAGVVPGLPIERHAPEVLMTIRSVGRDGRPVPKRAGRPWGKSYRGPPHVVFGHNALPDPQIHPWATGIDTGCVYGGRLTALVLPAGEEPPPRSARSAALVSVAARREYVKIHG